jgi:hypothetical protein
MTKGKIITGRKRRETTTRNETTTGVAPLKRDDWNHLLTEFIDNPAIGDTQA